MTATSCASDQAEGPPPPETSALDEDVAAVPEENGETLVYESIQHVDPESGETSLVSQTGAIDNELFQRYARPLNFDHEDKRVHFSAWRRPLEDGTIEEGTRVTTTSPGPAVDTTPEPETYVDPRLLEEAAEAEGDLMMLIRVRGFPDWDIPLVPDAATVGMECFAAALEDEAQALAAREALLDEIGSDVIELVGAEGGTIDHKLWSVGWLAVTVPVDALDSIVAHPDVHSVTTAHGVTGQGQSRETARPVEMVGEQAYWNDGQFGDTPNPAHNAGAIAVAIIERGPAKDEARGFCQDAACSSTKFYRRYRCDQVSSPVCVITTNYSSTLESVNYDATDHATTVATSAVADYMDDQSPGMPLAFKLAATSGPREAKLIHFGALGGFGYGSVPPQATFSYALYTAATVNKADIVTGGTFFEQGVPGPDPDDPFNCDFPSIGKTIADEPSEMAAEDAFDAGSFVAISPGNYCGPTAPGFVSSSPAHLPKVFTVSGLSMASSVCANGADYRTCKVDMGSSVQGGAPAKIGSTTYSNALSEVDLLVPQGLTDFTRCSIYGGGAPCVPNGFIVLGSPGDLGTSFAAPRLGGYAALVKDWFLENNKFWFNSPGWLHVQMLGQGDGHFSTAPNNPNLPTGRKEREADRIYGLGRVKLRHPDQLAGYGHDHRSLSFSSPTPTTYFVSGAPMPASAQIIKCVAVGHEDMSHKNNIGRFQLELRLRGTVGGQCSSSGVLAATRIDNTNDVKHMTVFRGSSTQVGGRCAEVTIRPMHLPTSHSIWTQTFCYFANVEDDAPN